ncbi:MAG: type VI secretion system tip protein VgrG [Candidatus Kapabacteria bacterium]|nr:type VI secretion system tip protein VgrG [Candidatus Kapabacteria bacterium]
MALPSLISFNGPINLATLGFESLRGDEYVSRPYSYMLELLSEDPNLDASSIVGQHISVGLCVHTNTEANNNPGLAAQKRFVSGIAASCSVEADAMNRITCRIEIVPAFALLRYRKNTRIFHNKTVEDIINAIAGENTIMQKGPVTPKITSATSPIEYCVQYNETDFDFLSRLMEEYGVWYYFTHSDGAHSMVISDDKNNFGEAPHVSTLKFLNAKPSDTDEKVWNLPMLKDQATHFALKRRPVSASFSSNDYFFETATTDLYKKVDASSKPALGGAVYHEFPGNYQTAGDGETIANMRIAMLESDNIEYVGRTYSRSLTAGHTFSMTEHINDALNQTCVVVSMHMEATMKTFHNTVVSIPASTEFRPERRTQKPAIHGYLSGKVVSDNEGDEIFTDEYGRVKVYFQWNSSAKKDENTSMFIRVAQMWAGKGWGTMFIPRVGMEAVVAFLDGDPDRPIVIGTLYNSDYTIPYPQPSKKDVSTMLTRSTPKGDAGNELRFTDTKGSEEVFLHGQKDWNTVIENDRTSHIKHDQTLLVDNDRTDTIKHDDTLTVEHDRKETIKNDDTLLVENNRKQTIKGTETYDVEKTRDVHVIGNNTETYDANDTVTVKGNHKHTVEGDYTITVKGNLKIEVDGDFSLVAKSIKMESKTGTDIDAGTTFKAEAKTSATMKGMTTTVQASTMGEVKADAMLTVKGGIVMIN